MKEILRDLTVSILASNIFFNLIKVGKIHVGSKRLKSSHFYM